MVWQIFCGIFWHFSYRSVRRVTPSHVEREFFLGSDSEQPLQEVPRPQETESGQRKKWWQSDAITAYYLYGWCDMTKTIEHIWPHDVAISHDSTIFVLARRSIQSWRQFMPLRHSCSQNPVEHGKRWSTGVPGLGILLQGPVSLRKPFCLVNYR